MAGRQLSSVRARLASPVAAVLQNRLVVRLLGVLVVLIALGMVLQSLSNPVEGYTADGYATAAGWVGVYAFGLAVILLIGFVGVAALKVSDGWKLRRERKRSQARRRVQ